MEIIDYLILASVLFTATIQGIFAKEYFVRTQKSSPVMYSLVTVIFALVWFVVSDIKSLDFSNILDFLPYSLMFALAYGLATVGSKCALKHGPMALGTLFGACSLLIPTFLGIAFLGNPPLPLSRWIGLGIFFASIAIANLKKEDSRITLLWVIFILMNIFGNGFCSFTQAAQGAFQNENDSSEFMILSLAFVAVAMAVFAFKDTKEAKVHLKSKNLWLYGILAGIANGYTNMMVIVLNNRKVPQAVTQPTVAAGGLVLTFIAAVLLYKEKQSKAKCISFALGAVSLILLNM